HRYVWYIDIDGYFKWFETTEDRGNVINISDDHPQLASLNIVEDNTNIVNYLEGYAGENSSIYRSVRDEASITQHGLLQGETIVDTNIIDGNVLLELLNTSIDNTKNPLYTATATFNGLLYTEPGQKHRFPDSDAYSSIDFTIVDITITGTPENHQTVINYSTDTSVLSADNSFEMVKIIAEAAAPKLEVAQFLYNASGDGSKTVAVQTSRGGTLYAQGVGYLEEGGDVLLIRGKNGDIVVGGMLDMQAG
ncbi:MAG: hypothetical protein Q7U45_00755, partial [Burkholderiaceae bacterium]|nr:hypothetical protein [Burkholderiaceae bacterium]